MNSKYLNCIIFPLSTFHAAECHLDPFQNTNTGYFTLFALSQKKIEKCSKICITFVTEFSSVRKKVVPSAISLYY